MPQALLVIDACLNRRLAAELKARGRSAIAASELGALKLKDPQLVEFLSLRFFETDWVLVTGDDAMPAEHGPVLLKHRVTVATVDGQHGATNFDHWGRDTVHRWAHAMATQPPGTWKRYSPLANREWTRRVRASH